MDALTRLFKGEIGDYVKGVNGITERIEIAAADKLTTITDIICQRYVATDCFQSENELVSIANEKNKNYTCQIIMTDTETTIPRTSGLTTSNYIRMKTVYVFMQRRMKLPNHSQ